MEEKLREKLVCDKRNGCVAIYKESNKEDTIGCHRDDKRNIAFSDKGAWYIGGYWKMDSNIQSIYEDMVNAYNEKYSL